MRIGTDDQPDQLQVQPGQHHGHHLGGHKPKQHQECQRFAVVRLAKGRKSHPEQRFQDRLQHQCERQKRDGHGGEAVRIRLRTLPGRIASGKGQQCVENDRHQSEIDHIGESAVEHGPAVHIQERRHEKCDQFRPQHDGLRQRNPFEREGEIHAVHHEQKG